MEKKNLYLIVLIVVLLAGIFFVKGQKPDFENQQKDETLIHQVKFYDERTFIEGVEKSREVPKPAYVIRGGIVPHHLFPGFIIADFFKRLSYQSPKTIILIGPNHYEKGNFKALTSLYGWQTPYGLINPDREFINKLISRKLVKVDEEVLPADHAVSGIIPFAKYYLPDAEVVPILLKGGFNEKESEVLASNLVELINEDTVVVAAVDFSHYLTSAKAQEKDKVTQKIMEEFDYSKLYLLNNDYLDSPASIGVLLKAMQKINATQPQILFHTNSGELQKNIGIETTSYFSTAFYSGETN